MFLTRRQIALELTKAGFPIAEATLATRATRGGGPAFRKFGGRVVYDLDEAMAWAHARLGKPMTSTSEAA